MRRCLAAEHGHQGVGEEYEKDRGKTREGDGRRALQCYSVTVKNGVYQTPK